MLFKRFLDKRKRASQDAKQADKVKSQKTLEEEALGHADIARRRAALHQLLNPAVIGGILAADADPSMREAAALRLRELLCQNLATDTPAAVFAESLSQIADLALLEHIARHGQLPEVRRLAITRIDSVTVLTDCAVEDRLAANRALAVERLDQAGALENKHALEDLLRRLGKRDKNIHRLAREKLRLIAEREDRPLRVRAQCADICAKIERLGRLGSWTQDRALLEHLDRQWAEIEHEAQPEWQDRFQRERERFLTAFDAHCRQDQAQSAAQAVQASAQTSAQLDAQALLAALAELCERDADDAFEVERARIATAWNALSSVPEPERRALNERYAALMDSATAIQRASEDHRRRQDRLVKIAAKAEQLLTDSKTLDQTAANALLDDGRALAAALPESDLTRDFSALAQRLTDRLRHQRKQAEHKLGQLRERIEVLEAHLAAGELKKADPIYQSIQAGLDVIRASGIAKSEEAQLTRRVRALAPRLRELQNWRRWGADQHREELCASMEALIEQDLSLSALAEQLRALQAHWKRLDKTGSPANQAFWQRFHSASEAVYARCRPIIEQQAAEREANRLARESACTQLEDFLAKVDWERVDWKRILRAERAMRQTWSMIGPTEGRHRKQLERRFHRSLKQLDQRLDAERKRNRAHKRALVERVHELVELPDLDQAIEQTKAIQRQWQTTVPARQRDENALWQSFRAACDAVFERRAAAQQTQASELQANLQTRQAICDAAHEIATHEQDPDQLATAQRELLDRWRATEGLPVPRQSATSLTRTWRDRYSALTQCLRAAEARVRSASLELLARQAELCQQLETSLLQAPERCDLHSIQTHWAELETHRDGTLQAAIQGRFERALTAAQDSAALAALRADYAANADVLDRLCLQLEIIAGVESPPALSQQRLEFQVARLSERMSEGEEDPLQGATRLLREWYLCGPAPRTQELVERFNQVREALAQHPSTAPETA